MTITIGATPSSSIWTAVSWAAPASVIGQLISASNVPIDDNELKARTPDGRPTARRQLNTNVPAVLDHAEQGILARLAQIWRRLNDILSGMYTGVRCGGTPHSHHSYDAEDRKP
jgi:hypothetical protein